MKATPTAALEGRRWIRRFRGGTVATLYFQGGSMVVEWENRPHPKQKSRIRKVATEYLHWKHSIQQGIADESGKAIIDISETETGGWEMTTIAPRKGAS